MEQPIAYFADDGRSWQCDGCGSYGSVGGAEEGRRYAARNIASHVAECTPAQAAATLPGTSAVIRPGDTVLIRLRHDAPRAQQLAVADRLRSRIPDVEVLVLAGIDGIDVYRPEEQRP
ncbi:hypothetical protein JL475_24320 [Streptomyces sp. M2CJ-2]|uniref:hypothetical protein n=1 Tax=Streptomyces sp. M2CJ-2 TaxID=2803948 RepID=UPI0019276D0C|nr:hypothetical protein [Streptomyces sp. M2CJ-2]MBL3669061.1 hypothetical protein [Streptomyces sp. M2CJ-2]